LAPQPDAPPLGAAGSSTPLQTKLQLVGICTLFAGYAALSHFGYTDPDAKGLGAALSVGPIVLIGVILLWRWKDAVTALAIAALACAILYRYWPVVEAHYAWSDLVQQSGLYSLVAAGFARSLTGERVPLCTQLAGKLHGTLAAEEVSYLRGATIAWTLFYVLLTAAIVLIYFTAPLKIWSVFVNFAVLGLIIAAGIVDLAARHWLLPRRAGDGILQIIRRSITG
jgi:uncharacterized membrane protein